MKVSNSSLYPCVMGIINITPDSFYAKSRVLEESPLRDRVQQIVREGGRIIDVGACSSRPGAPAISEEEELNRLAWAFPIILNELKKQSAEILVSVDTFRAKIAEHCVLVFGVDIINDISGGTLDETMFDVVARTRAAYIMMHMQGTPQDMQQRTSYSASVTEAVIEFFAERLSSLSQRYAEVNGDGAKPNVILDPGFGFAKTLDQNYELMRNLPELIKTFPSHPVLVGISRKSMVYHLLETDAEHSLNGTTSLNTIALLQGAQILRVHDVREAVEAVKMVNKLKD